MTPFDGIIIQGGNRYIVVKEDESTIYALRYAGLKHGWVIVQNISTIMELVHKWEKREAVEELKKHADKLGYSITEKLPTN